MPKNKGVQAGSHHRAWIVIANQQPTSRLWHARDAAPAPRPPPPPRRSTAECDFAGRQGREEKTGAEARRPAVRMHAACYLMPIACCDEAAGQSSLRTDADTSLLSLQERTRVKKSVS